MILYDDTEVKHKLKIFTHSIEKLNHSSFGEYHLTYTTGEVIIPPLSNVEPLKEELTHFYRCIQNSIPPLTDGKLGLGVVKWLELGDNSIREGGKMIYNKI
jgi:predicted dehydrogenase